ncbi:hypothetical protein G1C98_0745 [Bifidobacterium sp. DSM 109960]|uniref:Uncharacterized protein n=1 Tax=Bifidobacterium erythrocebi TaxID=2675325 RepID=A0A7Y0ETB9_9BIFI|nr:hypothetical protein [Bifidobacterium sp. DSM 109960]
MQVCKDCKLFTFVSVSFQYRWLWSGTVKKFFEGISISQIIAGSLAAITSFFLAGKIGIAGSTIGAAASYIISTVAGKVYQNVLKASGEKLQEANPLSGSSDKTDATDSADSPDKAEQTSAAVSEGAAQAGDESDGQSPQTQDTADMASVEQPRTVVSSGTLPSASGEDGKVQTFAQVRHHNVKRMAIVVSLISGLVGVAITAGVVLLFTQGKGTDTVVRDMTGKSSVVEKPDSGTDQDDQETDGSDPNEYGTHRQHNGYGDDTQYGYSNSNGQNGTGTDSTSGSTNSNKGSTSGTSGNSGSSSSGNSSSSGSSTNSGNSGSSSSGSSSSGTSGSAGSSSSTNSGTSGNSGSTSGTDSGSTGSTSSGTGDSSSSTGSN